MKWKILEIYIGDKMKLQLKARKSPWPEKMEASRPKRIPPRVLHTQAWSKTKLNSNLYFWVTWGSEDAGEWRKCWRRGWIYRLELGRIASALTSSSSIDLSVFHFDSAVLHWRWNIPRWVIRFWKLQIGIWWRDAPGICN